MILNEIANHARLRVANDRAEISLAEMKKMALNLPRGDFRFETVLRKNRVSIICEIKKASPSKGVISEAFPYLDIAGEYQEAGADCISVLTEPKWFLGSDTILKEVRAKTTLPLLRKDFTVDEYQIYQAKVLGADAVLLICALLDTEEIRRYLAICETLGLSTLVETHNQDEILSALSAGARIIGVNNRNLKDFTVDLSHSMELRQHIPADIIFVAESGIASPTDAVALVKSGANALLIGEALMRCGDKGNFIERIKTGAGYDEN